MLLLIAAVLATIGASVFGRDRGEDFVPAIILFVLAIFGFFLTFALTGKD